MCTAVSKKVHKNSVRRNKIKRRLREIFRVHRSELRSPHDLLIIARPSILELSFLDLRDELLHVLKRSGFLK